MTRSHQRPGREDQQTDQDVGRLPGPPHGPVQHSEKHHPRVGRRRADARETVTCLHGDPRTTQRDDTDAECQPDADVRRAGLAAPVAAALGAHEISCSTSKAVETWSTTTTSSDPRRDWSTQSR